METISCPICDSSSFVTVHSLSDRFNHNASFEMVKCECSFNYLNPRPCQDEMSKYYNNINYLPHSSGSNLISRLYKIAQSISFNFKFFYISKLMKYCKGKLLDIGSGKGEFCKFMKNKKWDVSGYEPYCFNKSANILPNKKYDIITMWHSIEHIHDLKNIFDIISSKLVNSGYLIIAVPNIMAYEQKFFNADWIAYDAPRHLYHFSVTNMNLLIEKYDFKIIHTKPIYQDTIFNIISS